MNPFLDPIDLSGITGYTYSRGQYTYFVLLEEIVDGQHTGCYLREYISKEMFDKLQGERDVEAKRAKV